MGSDVWGGGGGGGGRREAGGRRQEGGRGGCGLVGGGEPVTNIRWGKGAGKGDCTDVVFFRSEDVDIVAVHINFDYLSGRAL